MTLDVAIVGGSFAGLTAALQLGRASRTVAVFDTGRPRNAASSAAHGVPGWDGRPPLEILGAIRKDVAAYPTVTFADQAVTGLTGAADSFRLTMEAGEVLARRVILACGVTDRLPDIPGLAEGWGRWALHCPYCHGYEVKGRPLSILGRGPMALHMAQMLRSDWSADVTLIAHDGDWGPEAQAEAEGDRSGQPPPQELPEHLEGVDRLLLGVVLDQLPEVADDLGRTVVRFLTCT